MDRLDKINELRYTLNELRVRGAGLRKNFSVFEQFISQEKFPTLELLDDMNDDFSTWVHEVNKLFEIYTELFKGNKPRTFSELEKILDAEEKKIIVANTFAQAEKFLHLAAKTSDVKKSLEKYQKRLELLLSKKSRDDKVQAKVELYAKFIEAIEEKKNHGKTISLIREFNETFDDDFIGRTFIGKQLSFESDAPDDTADDTIDDTAADATDFAEILREKDALLTDKDFLPFEKLTITENERDIHAKRFNRDFDNPNNRHAIKLVIFTTLMSSGFSICTVPIGSKLPQKHFDSIAQVLVKKGYFKEYVFENIGHFYSLTRACFDFLKSEDLKKFFKNVGSESVTAPNEELLFGEDVRQILTRMIYFRFHAIERAQKNIRDAKKFCMHSFYAVFKSRHAERDLVLGCFWDQFDSGDDFLIALKNYLIDGKKFQRLIVTGLNREHAEKIFAALEAALKEVFPKEISQYVYSLEEDNFYRRGIEKTISLEKIFGSASPDDTDETTTEASDDTADDTPDDSTDDTPDDDSTDDAFDDSTDDATDDSTDDTSDDTSDDTATDTFDNTTAEDTDDNDSDSDSDSDADSSDNTTADDTDDADDSDAFNEMLCDKKFYCATAYLKALSLQDESYAPLYNQLAYATDDPLLSISYDAEKIISLSNESPEEYFIAAATLRTFFSNHNQFDYNMKTLHGIVKNFEVVEENSPLADLIFALMNFKDRVKKGADYYADYRLKNRAQTENKIAKLRQEAQTFLHRVKNLNDKAYMPRFIELKKFLFDDSALEYYLVCTTEDTREKDILDMKNYLQETFLKDGAGLSVENLDNFKFDTVIDNGWREAGKRILKKNNTKLVGELRNNISTSLKNAIKILCERVSCFEESAPLQSDEGVIAYKRIRTSLLENVKKTQEILASKKIAAAAVLIATLQEIADKLEGSFNPALHKYFYVDFLRSDKVLLDENYLPNFNFNTLDGTNTSIAERIVKHARAELPTFAERIENISSGNRDWDFGSVKLICDYFEDIGDTSLTGHDLQGSTEAARRIALDYKQKFFGFLELAQSYGQFDAAPENTKEKILKHIDRCFEFAKATNNYGIFVRVKEYWESKVKKDAAKYAEHVEKNLELGIKNYCRKTNAAEDSPDLQNSVSHIRKMIARRNYTVAQGLINRLSEGNLHIEPETSSSPTHLQNFLKDHADYYRRVSKSGVSLKILVEKSQSFSKAATSKGIKGGGILVDNWLPNGFPQNGDVGEDKLKKLLTALGFKVDSVKKTGEIDKKALNYKVRLVPPRNGQSSNYNHPIAAFGSNAEIYGFRVTCLFGYYDADGLIARFKEIGNADNTLVFLDYALELQTLRSLARKIKKSESGITKIFAVIDRVLMMYLIKNYDEMQINKMIMSLIMPFASCQPYVFNPNVPIPPEIFMGREKEIQSILDFDDVNIVYGGRQLGKTALLKMACASLDRNENNDRAIFVDINKCDCAAAALKISRALHAEKFFDESFAETDDWSELAAAIKKRLTGDKPDKIPHFMLALDEADDFIKDCRTIEFKPVLELIDVQQQRHNGSRFKFVMAGLRDVVRFYKDEALGNNNQISKLPSLVVKPFELEDAAKLLKAPLRCLGLYFSDDENSDSLATMILETTNYFPGLIQLYCAKLIEALSRPDYAGYKDTDSPVYYITERHIQIVLSDENFNEQIKNKINMTLRLGDDKFYYVIAHLMAWRYHNDDDVDGYSAKDILQTATEYGLENLLPKNVEQIEALLKELCYLNILRETDKGKYLFVRQRFLNMMGTTDEIADEIATDFSEI